MKIKVTFAAFLFVFICNTNKSFGQILILAQLTMDMDWSNPELVVYATNAKNAQGLVYLPSDNALLQLFPEKKGNSFHVITNPLHDKVNWKIRSFDK